MGPLQALGLGSSVTGLSGLVHGPAGAKIERDRLILALVLIFASIVFFALFEQAGSTLNQFDDRNATCRTATSL